jgi:hypothetical protein
VLLLIPSASTLGAVLFFPIILNIFLITFSLEFTGTPLVTGGMLLANLFLLCWDWHRLKPLFFAHAAPVAFPEPAEGPPLATRLERAGYVAVTVGGIKCASGVLHPWRRHGFFLANGSRTSGRAGHRL